MSTKKLEAVLICGQSKDCDKELLGLYAGPKSKYRVIKGNDIINGGLNELRNKIDFSTRIDIYAHGAIYNDEHHLIIENLVATDLPIGQPTAHILQALKGYSPNSPLQIHIWSCYGGAADVKDLAEGSFLFSHISAQHPGLIHVVVHSIKKSLQTLARLNSPSSQLYDFIDTLPFNLLQTATIATYVNGKSRKLILEPTLLKVMAKPDQVLKDSISKISNFVQTINELLKLKSTKAYPNFKLERSINKVFSEEEKKEFQIGCFLHACAMGDVKAIKQLFERSSLSDVQALINQKIINETSLRAASIRGRLEVVKLLIEHGVTVNDVNNSEGGTSMIVASQEGYADIVYELAKAGADVNAVTITGATSLFLAAEKGHMPVVEILLDQGAKVDEPKNDGSTPLFVAAKGGKEQVVQELLKRGADSNKAMHGSMVGPLHVAAEQGHAGVVAMLAEYADIDMSTAGGWTALFLAARKGHGPVVSTLVNYGADINKLTPNGTPLHIAIIKGNYDVVKALISAGANLYLSHPQGYTTLELAQHFKDNGMLDIIKSAIEADHNSIVKKEGYYNEFAAGFSHDQKFGTTSEHHGNKELAGKADHSDEL